MIDDRCTTLVRHDLLPSAPPRPTAAHPSSDHPRLMAKRRDRLRVRVPIGAPRPELQRAGERTERRRAARVRRRPRGERLAVDEDQLEVLPAGGLQLVGVRVVRAREGRQQRAGLHRGRLRWRRGRCVGGT